MGDVWPLILDFVIVLGAAALVGLLFERLRLGSILGYLVAGVVVGPSVLNLVEGGEVIDTIAEIGVSLLLFTIGLEFSWKQLVRFSGRGIMAGSISILAIIVVTVASALALGLDWRTAVAIGAAASLGSTAIVFRVLRSQNNMDSTHGRFAVVILLTQDIAIVPLALLVTFLAGRSGDLAGSIGGALLGTALLVLGMTLLVSLVIPRLLNEKVIARNREIPILIAITTAVGATWAAHAFGLPPALGALIAGLMLAEGRFADQMRADALPLRTLFMTVFFVSIGLLADVQWIGANLPLVLGGTAFLILVKSLITYASVRPFQISIVESLATAIALAQVGEFSFVLLLTARGGGLLDDDLFRLATSITMLTLFVTPLLAGNAQRVALRLAKTFVPKRKLARAEIHAHHAVPRTGHIIVVGFGAAGRAAATMLFDEGEAILVIDLNPMSVQSAERCGIDAFVGDATQHTILDRAHADLARAMIVAISDHLATRSIITNCKQTAPGVPLFVRSRYHDYAEELDVLGADIVVDEEHTVGRLLGRCVLDRLRMGDDAEDESSER